MGHAYLQNLDQLMVKQIYAHGKVSIADMAAFAKKKGEALRCAEGPYESDDDYNHVYGMVRIGLEWCIRWHMHGWGDKHRAEPDKLIVPIIETDEQQKIYNAWVEADDSWSEEELEIMHSIKWKFGEGGRKCYLADGIDWLDHYET